MARIQIYPSSELEEQLVKEAEKYGITVSALVNEKLEYIYCKGQKGMALSEITGQVLEEAAKYVADAKEDAEFDLYMASPTFCEIDKMNVGNAGTIRAQIGRCFGRLVGKEDFAGVMRVKKPNGENKVSIHGASLYQITK